MSRRRVAVVSLVAALAVTLVACEQQEPEFTAEDQVAAEDRPEEEAENGEAEEEPAGETVTFVAIDIDWQDPPSEIPTGDVQFELVNEGGILHDLAIEELGGEVIAEAQPGETDTGTATIEPGEYTIYCEVPGHREAGMEATVTAG